MQFGIVKGLKDDSFGQAGNPVGFRFQHCCDQKDGDVLRRGITFYGIAQFPSISLVEQDIHNKKIGLEVCDRSFELIATVDACNKIGLVLQYRLNNFCIALIIIQYKNL